MLNENIVNELIEYVISIEPNEDIQEALYEEYEEYIINTAKEIRSHLKYKGGAYYPIQELFNNVNVKNEFKYFVLDQLKILGIEYFRNELYRVVD